MNKSRGTCVAAIGSMTAAVGAERALAALESLKALFFNIIEFYHLGASRVKFRACF